MNKTMLVSRTLMLISLALAGCPGDESADTTGSSSTGAAESSSGATTDDGTTHAPTTGESQTVTSTTETSTTETSTTDALTTGATTGEPIDPEALVACEKVLAAELAYTTWSCECLVGLGAFVSVDACLAEMEVYPDGATCACPLLAADPEHKEVLLCHAAAAGDLPGCIEEFACDAPDEAVMQCVGGTLGASRTCGLFPRSAAVELQCHGAAPVACGSGELIPDSWTCDNYEDCRDLSDEVGCSFVCDSGELIPIDWKCDGEPDCEDMSDEVGCR